METTIATQAPVSQATDHHNEIVSVMAIDPVQMPCPFTQHSDCDRIATRFAPAVLED